MSLTKLVFSFTVIYDVGNLYYPLWKFFRENLPYSNPGIHGYFDPHCFCYMLSPRKCLYLSSLSISSVEILQNWKPYSFCW